MSLPQFDISGDKALLDSIRAAFPRMKGDPNDDASIIADLILEYCGREGASDIHLEPKSDYVTARMRVDGILRDVLRYAKTEFPIGAKFRVLAGFSPQSAVAYTPEDGRFQLQIEGRSIQVRVSTFPTLHGEKLVMRILDMGSGAGNLETLGFSDGMLPRVRKLISSPSGLFIVSGMTGCGKTTTLAGVLQELSSPERNIMTIEDPVEYELPLVTHSQVNTRAGFGFAEALRNILRQDPNIIMLGEIRDRETAEIALRAATSGHMIFSTVHAPTTTGVIHRLLSMEVEPYMIASSLTGVLAQRLARRVCPACALPSSSDMNFFQEIFRTLDSSQVPVVAELVKSRDARFLKAKGCPQCGFTGYKGRIGIFELFEVGPDTRQMIFENSKSGIKEIQAAAIASGMKPLIVDAIEKIRLGITTQEEVSRIVI
ncbi:MAG: GspE/PulE family protein [Elusimicrobiaceae bacterium]